MSDVLASLVTFNDSEDVQRCVESLRQQTVPVRIEALDNNSHDATRSKLRALGVDVVNAGHNSGYSAGHNYNLTRFRCPYVLFLNADTLLEPDYVETLVETLERHSRVGLAGGKVWRMGSDGSLQREQGHPVLDTTGIYFTPSQRHLDRGSGHLDRGQFEVAQLVFGISGALLMAKRQMLDQLKAQGEVFDEDFFSYREDADLAWRAQLLGWHALYMPRARGMHRRVVTPARRRQLSPSINCHSLKNRYLMRLKNMDSAVFWRCFPYLWLRDAAILAYVLSAERPSLPAYRMVRELRSRFLRKRAQVAESRRVGPRQLVHWFDFRPRAIDVGE